MVDLIKEEGDSGFGFHLIGSGPVVISTIEPGTAAKYRSTSLCSLCA